jgi:hypothetical protein
MNTNPNANGPIATLQGGVWRRRNARAPLGRCAYVLVATPTPLPTPYLLPHLSFSRPVPRPALSTERLGASAARPGSPPPSPCRALLPCLRCARTGVPLSQPVAGIAMGLVLEPNGQFAVLTDILGSGEHTWPCSESPHPASGQAPGPASGLPAQTSLPAWASAGVWGLGIWASVLPACLPDPYPPVECRGLFG